MKTTTTKSKTVSLKTQLHNDLKYWSDKWVNAEKHMYGPAAVTEIETCRLMVDRYLDQINSDKKSGIADIERELAAV